MERKCGVLDEKSSSLLYSYEIVCAAPFANEPDLPAEYRLPAELIPDCRDQGSTGQCVAFTVTNIMQILNWKETGDRKRYSTTYVYGRHRDSWERLGYGMYPEKVLDKLCKRGSVSEDRLPQILENPEAYDLVWHHPELHLLDKEAETYKIKSYVGLTPYGDSRKRVLEAKKALYQYQIPIFGVMRMQEGSHAISIIGWDEEKLYYMNSWGSYVGDKGICSAPYKEFTRFYLMIDAENLNPFPFVDVPIGKWSRKAIEHCYNANLIEGFGENKFNPEGLLTRAQMCQIIWKFGKKIDAYNNNATFVPFNDVEGKHWAESAIAYCYSLGIVDGYDDGTFKPDKEMTRGELCKVMAEFGRKVCGLGEAPETEYPFEDHWAKDDIHYLYGLGIVDGVGPNTFNPNGLVTREQACQILYKFAKVWDKA